MLQDPDNISKTVLAKGLDSGTAFEILSIDIADVDVGKNIGADLQTDQAEADKRVAQAAAESRRAMAVAAEQENVAEIAAAARDEWARWPWEERASVFLKAAELLATTWRDTVNAATMLGQSKTVFQAEIDSACELIDFWRFNPAYAQELYAEQPLSNAAMWNQLDYRPLEGFVFALTPFNFASIAGNLPTAPALMGNTVVWKPASRITCSGRA